MTVMTIMTQLPYVTLSSFPIPSLHLLPHYNINIQMFTTYRDYYYKYYAANGWSSTHTLCLLTLYLTLALPFYFCFAGGPFWTDSHSSLMSVNYNYTGYYALQVSYLNSGNYATDQYTNIPGNAVPVVPLARSHTLAVDDRLNTTTASLTLNGYSFEVVSANVILYFDVEVPTLNKIVSQAVQYSIAGNVVSGGISGVVSFAGNSPIEGMRTVGRANLPLYYPFQSSGFTFATLSNYASQNNGLLKALTQSSLITSPSTSTPSTRTTTLTLNKLKSTVINYSPTLLQTLKFKYSTYLAFAIISYYVFSTLFKLYIDEGMLEGLTYVERIR